MTDEVFYLGFKFYLQVSVRRSVCCTKRFYSLSHRSLHTVPNPEDSCDWPHCKYKLAAGGGLYHHWFRRNSFKTYCRSVYNFGY